MLLHSSLHDVDLAQTLPRHTLLSHVRARYRVSLLLLQGSVREQLEALCDRSPVCAPAMLRKQRETIGQLQSEVETLRMQLHRSQTQVQQLQQQLEAAQAADHKD